MPPIEKEEDILENYSTYHIIDLSYRMGLLVRSEWRRMQRCYEIRKDLEHEDNAYEAVLEDCFYIFKSTIEVVLSQDPIELLKVTDVRQIVEEPQRITVTEELLEDYSHAPELRQKEIIGSLVALAKNSDQPDIVRENSFELLRHFNPTTKTPVTIRIAQDLEKRLGRDGIDIVTAKIGHAIGATAYFKRVKIRDYYNSILSEFKSTGSNWSNQAKVVSLFYDIGHFKYCPKDLIRDFLKFLVLWYIGEPGGYGTWGRNRVVFYSDAAAPIIKGVIKNADINLSNEIEKLRKDRDIEGFITNKHILSRFENLLDVADKVETES